MVDHNVSGPTRLGPPVRIAPDGRFTITVKQPSRYRASVGKAKLDLQVLVFSGRTLLGRSAVAYNTIGDVQLDVQVEPRPRAEAAEWDRIFADLAGLLPRGDAPIDVAGRTYLSNKTGWNVDTIGCALDAIRIASLRADRAALSSSHLYALLRAGLPTETGRLFRAAPATVLAIWRHAIAERIIPLASEAELEAACQSYIALATAEMLDGEGATLRPMLAPVLPSGARQQTFARLIVEHGGAGPGFEAAIETAFGAPSARRLHRLGILLGLVDGDVALATALLAVERRLAGTAELVDRGYAEADRWASLPAGVAPSPARAAVLADRLRRAHPLPALAQRLRQGMPGFGDHAAEVADFIRHHADASDLGREPVEAYLRRTGDAAPPAPVLAQIKRLQRVRRLVDDDAALMALFRTGYDSALRIARQPPSVVQAAFTAALPGVAPAVARRIHARAQRVHGTVLNAATAYVMDRRTTLPGGAGAPVTPMDTTGLLTGPTLEALFGSLDGFACTECASILGPAAYLTDLLAFLDLAGQPGGGTALDVLLVRRPDLQDLALTCANADIALPYIDVVVETLEYLVAHGGAIDGYGGYDTPDSLTSAELLASPQNVLLSAYPVLRTAMFPSPLPYNRTLELLRLHVQRLGFALPDMMQALRPSDTLVGAAGSYGWTDILIERLGLSRDEVRLFTDPSLQLGDLYGLPNPDALGTLQAMTVQELSRRLGISYDDLFAILQTSFINPAAALIPRVEQLQTSFQAISDLNATVGTPGSTEAAFLAALPSGIDATKYGGATPSDLGAIVTWVTTPAVFEAIMGLITVGSLGDPSTAQPADMQLLHADPTLAARELGETDWLKLIRFIRLRAKLVPLLGSDPTGQTDAILTALFPAADLPAGIDPTADRTNLDTGFATLLSRAGSLFEGMGRLGLGADSGLAQMLALWAPIGTAGSGALYDRMFLSPALLKVEAAVQSIVLDAVAPGDTIILTVDGIAIPVTVLASDTPGSTAAALAAAVNATETVDAIWSLPVNQVVAASANGPTVLLQLLGTNYEPVIGCVVEPDTGWSAQLQPIPFIAGLITLEGPGVPGSTITTTVEGTVLPLVVTDSDTEALAADLATTLSAARRIAPGTRFRERFVYAESVGAAVLVTTPPNLVMGLAVTNTAASPVMTVTVPVFDTLLFWVEGRLPPGQVLTIALAGVTVTIHVADGATPDSLAGDLADAVTGNAALAMTLTAAAYGSAVVITSSGPIDAPTLSWLVSACSIGQQAQPFARDAYGDVLTNPSLSLLDFAPLLCAAFNLTGAELGLIASALDYGGTTPLTLETTSEVFRRGWLAHALGISVAELLALVALTGLDPFLMPDPAAAPPVQPPSTRVITLVQALLGAGLTVSQALYLVFDQDLAGTAAPPLSDILGLATTLRADFAAVEAQFALQSDPDGTIAQSLTALVYGSAVADFFFGLITPTFVSAVPYATAPDATLPQPVLDAAGCKLALDPLHQTLTFTGVLDGTTLAAIGAAAAGMPAGFAPALAALAASNAQAIQPFFSAYPDLASLYAGYAASTASLPDRRTALLALMLPALRQSRKQEQAIASLAALLDLDQVPATAMLMDASVLHAEGTPGMPAVMDLVALEAGGLSAALASGTALPCVPSLAYLQTVTLGGTTTVGDQIVTTIAGATLTYAATAGDASPAILAASLAAAINADVADPATGLPGLAQSVVAQAAGPTVLLSGRDPAGEQDLFSLTCTTQPGAATTCATGTQWPGDGIWSGYLVAPQDGAYDISVTTDLGATVTLAVGGAAIAVGGTTAGTTVLAVTLSAGAPVPVSIGVSGATTTMVVRWQSAGTGWASIPASALYPATATASLQATYTRVLKAGALGTLLTLAPAEILRGDGTPGCVQWLNQVVSGTAPSASLQSMLTDVLQGLLDFARVKAALSPGDGRLLAAVHAGQPAPLLALTGWKQSSLDALLAGLFGGPPVDYGVLATTAKLARVFDAYAYASSCRVEPSVLLDAVTNDPVTLGVGNLQASLRAQYAEADWLTIVTPLNNTMRMQQRDALMACAIQQIEDANVVDADGVYALLLMDPLTQPAVQTSRIRLALSSVQLFVERALRALEPGVALGADLAAQWPAMGRYRVWQANREIFLWPENWLYPELRDDASPLFQATMAALLQTDITDDAAEGAYIGYLTGLEQIAKLEPCGLYYVDGDDVTPSTSYIVARTPGAHRKHFTRTVLPTGWTPWQEVKLDCDDMPLTPIVWNGRLFLFWLKLIKQGAPVSASLQPGSNLATQQVSDLHMSDLQGYAASTSTSITTNAVLCWVEQVNGQWTDMKTSDVKNPITIATGADIEARRGSIRLRPISTSWFMAYPYPIDTSSLDSALILQVAVDTTLPQQAGFVLHNTNSLPIRVEDIQFTASNGDTASLSYLMGFSVAPTYRTFPDMVAYWPGTTNPANTIFNLVASVPAALDETPAAPSFSLFQRGWAARVIDAQPGTAAPALTPFLYEDPQNLLYFTPGRQEQRRLLGVTWPSLRDPPVVDPPRPRSVIPPGVASS